MRGDTSTAIQAQVYPFLSNDWCWQVFALLLGPGLAYAYIILVSADRLSEQWLYYYSHSYIIYYIIWLAFHVGFWCLWLWLVLRFVLNERLSSLTLKPGTLRSDLLDAAAILVVLYFITPYVEHFVEVYLHGGSTGSTRAAHVAEATSPLMLFLKLGPTIWLGAAIGEEFKRIMLLFCLLKLGRGRYYSGFVVALSALLFGLCHIYQGSIGVASAALWGLAAGYYYLNFGRPWALVLSHGMYDMVVTLLGVLKHTPVHHS